MSDVGCSGLRVLRFVLFGCWMFRTSCFALRTVQVFRFESEILSEILMCSSKLEGECLMFIVGR